jgi:hypothetical protein
VERADVLMQTVTRMRRLIMANTVVGMALILLAPSVLLTTGALVVAFSANWLALWRAKRFSYAAEELLRKNIEECDRYLRWLDFIGDKR